MKTRTNNSHRQHQTKNTNDECQKKNNNSGMKIKWTTIEDDKLTKAVEKYHHKNWKLIANEVDGRSPKQCLERWYGMLDPSLIKTEFTPEEDNIIIDMQNRLGNKWSLIAECLPGRSAISVRNRSDLLKRHAKNPSLSKRQLKSNIINGNLESKMINQSSLNNDFQIQPEKASFKRDPMEFESTKNMQCNDNDFNPKQPPNQYLEMLKNNEIQKYFSGNSWTELDRYFSNINDLIIWEKTELF